MQKRRDFLRATLVAVGAAFVPGCGSDETEPTPERKLTDGAAYFPQSIASGDPKEGSVILWTRLEDASAASADASLELEVAEDGSFKKPIELDAAQAKVTAKAAHDHCVKVKLTGLSAGKVYYFRFIYVKGEKSYVSHVGRTKTAPAAGADVAVKFAFVSCQDFIGRHYNTYLQMAKEELDFLVHLGDYIYETTGDPSFQNVEGRKIAFADQAGAIALGEGAGTYYAAASLDNYRQLYKTYRGDAALQAIHENVPLIATWDDHEYSDDCSGTAATYFDGKKDEHDVPRVHNAHQAWFEYMPVDYATEGFEYDATVEPPGDIRIYRDFTFGKHVHLVMTDLRSYRAPSLIPGDAFPGTVVLDQAALTALLGKVPDAAGPYIDVETYAGGAYKAFLAGAATTAGFDAAKATGKISVFFINSLLEAITPPPVPLIDEATQATLERGLAYLHCGKTSFYSSAGSRYVVLKDGFDILARARWEADEDAQRVMGADQESWFLSTMKGSNATWKVWGNEYCLTQVAIDLSNQPVPASFAQRIYINVDGWDGYRDRRSMLLDELAPLGGVVAVTGDIHASFAGTPMSANDPANKIVEFVGSSISSATLVSMVLSTVKADPVIGKVPGVELLAKNIDGLMMDKETKVNPQQGFGDSTANGFVIVEASGAELVATYHTLVEIEVTKDYTANPADLDIRFKKTQFKTKAAESGVLYQDMSGKELKGDWKKWDPATQAWV